MRYRVDDGGDTTILMNSVKVKGIKQWEDIQQRADSALILSTHEGRFTTIASSLEGGDFE